MFTFLFFFLFVLSYLALPFSQTTLIIICVGGGIAVLLLFLFFLLICAIYCTKRKRKDYDTYFANKDHLKYSSSGASASGAVELGSYTKNPVFSGETAEKSHLSDL